MHRLEARVAAGQPGQVVEAEVVLRRRRRAPVRLEQAHQVRPQLAPETLFGLLVLDKGVEVGSGLGVRHRDVAGEDVVQRRDVGAALDAGVPPQRENPAARAADVAQQRLQDRRRADVLHADSVVRPTHRVDECAGPLASRVALQLLAHPQELLLRHTAGLLDDLRCVAREVPLEDLEDAGRVLERLVGAELVRDRGAARPVGLAVCRCPPGVALLLALGRHLITLARTPTAPPRPRTASVLTS